MRIKLAADHDGRTIVIQYTYVGLNCKSLRVSVLRTLDFSDGTTDALNSEAGSFLLQFGEVLEERHFDSAENTA